jgi:hypothetical protein
VGCAAAIGASIAFPAGLMIGLDRAPRHSAPAASRPGPASGGETRDGRNPYSPRIATDPYVIEQQRRVLRMLEASCRQSSRHCAEAGEARRRIEEAEAGR